MLDYRIGKRVELHPATDRWMRGDRYGVILSISKRSRSFLDSTDPRNGQTFKVKMDKSGKTIRISEGNITEVF